MLRAYDSIQHNSIESPLLRLPLEIRELIWSMVLGERLLHLAYNSDISDVDSGEGEGKPAYPWVAIFCLSKHSEHELYRLSQVQQGAAASIQIVAGNETMKETPHWQAHSECEQAMSPWTPVPYWGNGRYRELSASEIKPQLQILRTCRPIYIEAARLLWCTNTFSFNDARTFKEFMSCCNSAQTRLMTKLHLDITLHSPRRVGDWDSALTMTNVKSLKSLKTLHISLKRIHLRCPPNESQTRFDTILRDLYTQRVTRFKILPLENVTVVVENEAYSRPHEATHWPSSVLVDWAETIRSTILDPEGPMRWQEEQDQTKEFFRHQKELAAHRRRSIYTCRLFSSDAECAEYHQKQQDKKDKKDGRVRKVRKIAMSCGCNHVCQVCLGKKRLPYKIAQDCPQPGNCDGIEDTPI
jgi:hypothetical protein